MPRPLWIVLVLVQPGNVAAQTTAKHVKFFAEMKVLDPKGSPLRVPVEDWAGAKQRVVAVPNFQKWLKNRVAEVTVWMARQDKVEWQAGLTQYFVSPKDGSFLTWTPEEPKDFLSSPTDPKVAVTPVLHDAWVAGFRTRVGEQMVDAATLYRLTGDKKYADWAVAQLDFYADNYLRWPIQNKNGKSRIMGQSLDDATLMIRHIETVRILGDAVTEPQKRRWHEKLFKPGCELLDESYQRVHNISLWHRCAQAQVGLLYNDKQLWSQAIDGPFGIRKQVAVGVNADYLWFEQSLAYNQYVVQALAPFFTVAALSGKMPELQEEMLIVENLMLSAMQMRFVTGQLPNPADSTGGLRKAPNPAAYAQAYRIFPTYLGLEAASKTFNRDTLLDPPSVPKKAPPLPPPQSRNLEASRMAIVKKGPWQIYFHYGQLDKSHSQAEALNFEAFYNDIDITHDPGTVGYGSALHKEYYTKGLNHNVPLIAGNGQASWGPGKLLLFDPKLGKVAASQTDYQPGFLANRELKIDGQALSDTVNITGDAKVKAQKLGLSLHLQGKAALPKSFEPDPNFASPDRPLAFKRWTNPRTASFAKSVTINVLFGKQPMKVTFTSSGPFTLTQAQALDVPPKTRDAFYLETLGQAATFRTTIAPAK